MTLQKILLMSAIAMPVSFGVASFAAEPMMLVPTPSFQDADDGKKKMKKERKYRMSDEMKAKHKKCDAMEGEDKAKCMKMLNEEAKAMHKKKKAMHKKDMDTMSDEEKAMHKEKMAKHEKKMKKHKEDMAKHKKDMAEHKKDMAKHKKEKMEKNDD